NKFLNDSIPALVGLTIGFSVVLFFYRGRLEAILRKLHDGTTTLEIQKTELSRLKEEAELAYAELKRTQNRIVAQEKLASLGALIAGIAHEIKNPLNFITNFAQSSVELMDELRGHVDKYRQALSTKDQEDVDYLLAELDRNMKDISQHGQRGDRIVKSMLLHSREASGVFSSEDIGVLAEECVNLAFHALRAQDTSFRSGKTLHIPEGLPPVDLVRADFARVLLNLCSNAFYSVHRKRLTLTPDSAFEPMVTVTVASPKEELVLSVGDNGVGISPEVRAKLFTPFFTTKPAGEGTGLGLSLSHDIIVQEHGGQIDVESTEGQGACFTIRVPLRHRSPDVSGVSDARVLQ
ncbi:MAG TPA: ATP-binding protein, partial [Spirochaetia bacterium]|nr:ATP-binding protein [Spirochaetia bacterium]